MFLFFTYTLLFLLYIIVESKSKEIVVTSKTLNNTKLIYNPKQYPNGEGIRKCVKDSDCVTDSWCNSIGTICSTIQGICMEIPNVPCTRIQTCDDKTRKCIDRRCFTRNECSDNLYCNGFEKCHEELYICVLGDPPCGKDSLYENTLKGISITNDEKSSIICDEETRGCYGLKNDGNNKNVKTGSSSSSSTTITTTTKIGTKDFIRIQSNNSDLLWDPNSQTNQIIWLTVFVTFATVISLCIIIMFLYIFCRAS